jgi:hypothetical protein
MENDVTSMEDLAVRIHQLEEEEKQKTAALKTQVTVVLDGFRPSSLLKSAVSEIATSKSLREGAIDTSIGLGAGWLVRKIYQANSKSIFKKLTGFILQSLTTGFVTGKIPEIRQKVADL